MIPFMITPREIKLLFLGLIFGIAYWFIYSGARDWWATAFPSINSFWVGLGIILLFLGLYKFKGVLPFR
jgi:hypothetical protein